MISYPRPDQGTLLSNIPATKYLKSRSSVEQQSRFVSQLLLESSEAQYFVFLFPTGYGKQDTKSQATQLITICRSLVRRLLTYARLLGCFVRSNTLKYTCQGLMECIYYITVEIGCILRTSHCINEEAMH